MTGTDVRTDRLTTSIMHVKLVTILLVEEGAWFQGPTSEQRINQEDRDLLSDDDVSQEVDETGCSGV